ncbi:helix-turn-helix transcriptional regulator [Pseudonocardia sp. ICBG1293]|uniref:helix-turn-helix domain-containing protein n=1 Tax=Pseudonocardia sp. ICBG1293 TaxID=2844382 RepID=UPI001CCE949D|nr:helix-turn-helix transcriptional regulator [Pseudonocardia sp. ICBG1293]
MDLAPLLERGRRELADATTATREDRELRQRLEALALHAACEDPSGAAQVWEWVVRTDPDELGDGPGADVLRSAHLLFSALGLHTDAATAAARTAEAMPADLEDDAYLHPMRVAALGLLCWSEAATGLGGVRRRTLDAAHRTNRPDVEAFLRGVESMRLLRRGQVPAALAAALASLDVLTGETRLMVVRASPLACVELGRTAEAERLLAPVDDRVTSERTWRWSYLLDARAAVLAATGRTREALALTLECGHRLMSAGIVNPVVLDWRRRAVELHHELGEHEAARTAAEEYVALCRRWGAEGYVGAALRVLGLAQGGEQGLATLRSARAALAASPLALDRARCTVDLGARVRAEGGAGEARALLRHGLELAAECGAPTLAARARTELAAAGGRPRRGGSSSLTPAELGVARLAAGGATNRDIAAVLGSTLRAVEGHLTRVYRKLGIDGRAGLASAPGLRVGDRRPGGPDDGDDPTRQAALRP